MSDRPVTQDDLVDIFDRLRVLLVCVVISFVMLALIGSLAYRQAVRNHEIPKETRHILCVGLAQLEKMNEKLLAEHSDLPPECTPEVLRGD